VTINQLNLFLFSQISDAWSVNVRLQFDTWVTGELNPLRLSLAEIVWEPPDDLIRVSVGRFVNPFGLYPQRQLSVQNLFVNTRVSIYKVSILWRGVQESIVSIRKGVKNGNLEFNWS